MMKILMLLALLVGSVSAVSEENVFVLENNLRQSNGLDGGVDGH